MLLKDARAAEIHFGYIKFSFGSGRGKEEERTKRSVYKNRKERNTVEDERKIHNEITPASDQVYEGQKIRAS